MDGAYNSDAVLGTSTLAIIYGTETGTAQDLADQFWRSAHRRNVPASVHTLDVFLQTKRLPQQKIVIFLVATSDQGEFPASMRLGWQKLLQRSLPGDWLSGVKIAVLGLGDSSYPKFNFPAKKLFRRLLQLGASPIVELGLADDQHPFGPDTICLEWAGELWEEVYKSRIFESMFPDEILPYPTKYRLEFSSNSSDDDEDQVKKSEAKIPPTLNDKLEYFPLAVVTNQRVTAESHFQDTRLITFDTCASSTSSEELLDSASQFFPYCPGDVLMVHPENLPESIELVVESLRYSEELLDREFTFVPNHPQIPPPPEWLLKRPTSLRECLLRYFDIQPIPKRSFLRMLASLSPHGMERERLEELAAPESYDDYLEYCQRPRRTIAELLRDFPNTAANIPPQSLFDLLPLVYPRAFSIASSPVAHPARLQILVARVLYKAKQMTEPRRGLCSNHLCSLSPGDRILARTRPGTFQLASSNGSGPHPPLMMVGPGTGVAPFRSIIADYSHRSADKTESILLFYGCRNEANDFYFKEEWPNYGKNLELITAFSRDQREKIYVQHRILENKERVWARLSDPDCKIMIAGSSGDMPKAVISALREVVASNNNGGCTPEKFISDLEDSGRIQFETW